MKWSTADHTLERESFMRKNGLGVRLVLAGILLLVPVAIVSAGKVNTLALTSVANDSLMARTFKLKAGVGGLFPTPPTEELIERMTMADTGGTANYVYHAVFDHAVKYPVGGLVKWKVNRFTDAPGGIINYGVEITRGETAATP